MSLLSQCPPMPPFPPMTIAWPTPDQGYAWWLYGAFTAYLVIRAVVILRATVSGGTRNWALVTLILSYVFAVAMIASLIDVETPWDTAMLDWQANILNHTTVAACVDAWTKTSGEAINRFNDNCQIALFLCFGAASFFGNRSLRILRRSPQAPAGQ